MQPEMAGSAAPDLAFERAAAAAGVPFASATEAFRREAAARSLYFEWDNHLNADGHRLLGDELAAPVAAALEPAHAR
jgi:hypothetical protein